MALCDSSTPSFSHSRACFYHPSSFPMSSSVLSKKLQIAPGRKRDSKLILECFQGVTILRPYWNKWIVASLWLDIIYSRYELVEDLQFSSKELQTAISRNKVFKSKNIETTVMPNPLGIYKCWKNIATKTTNVLL